MQKILAYPLTVLYFLFFGLTLLVFHPIQWLCFNVFGYKAHKKSVDLLNLCLTRCLHILGTRIKFETPNNLPKNVPVIIVANHQSMNDIPPIIWFLRQYHVKFISKKELGKGIPSVSYNLRHGGSVLIDRKNAAQALTAIQSMANYIEMNQRAVVIFPEGTRSRNGQPKPFQTRGLKTLITEAPNAFIFPITINNSWKILRYGKFPMGIGSHIKFKVHQPIKLSEVHDHIELIKSLEETITSSIRLELTNHPSSAPWFWAARLGGSGYSRAVPALWHTGSMTGPARDRLRDKGAVRHPRARAGRNVRSLGNPRPIRAPCGIGL